MKPIQLLIILALLIVIGALLVRFIVPQQDPVPFILNLRPTPTQTPPPAGGSTTTPTKSPPPTTTPTPPVKPSTTPISNTLSITTFTQDGINVSVTCQDIQMNVLVNGNLASSPNSSVGLWGAIEDNTTGQRMIYLYLGNGGSYTNNIHASFPPVGPIRGSSLTLVADGRDYWVRYYYANPTSGMPTLGTPFAQVLFHRTCP